MKPTIKPIRPTSINWVCLAGIILHYKHKTADELVSSGLLNRDELPQGAKKKGRNGALCVSVTKDGAYNVRIAADDVLARDKPFKQFLGGLLADTRLSLVQCERS